MNATFFFHPQEPIAPHTKAHHAEVRDISTIVLLGVIAEPGPVRVHLDIENAEILDRLPERPDPLKLQKVSHQIVAWLIAELLSVG